MSNRDGRTAKGKGAGHPGREYWSRRLPGACWPWGAVGKWVTHRRERAAAKREEHRLRVSYDDNELE
jgi:hypothetical protein